MSETHNASIDPFNHLEPEPSNYENLAGYLQMSIKMLGSEDLCLSCGNHGEEQFIPDPELPKAVGISVCGVCKHYASFVSARRLLQKIETKAGLLI